MYCVITIFNYIQYGHLLILHSLKINRMPPWHDKGKGKVSHVRIYIREPPLSSMYYSPAQSPVDCVSKVTSPPPTVSSLFKSYTALLSTHDYPTISAHMGIYPHYTSILGDPSSHIPHRYPFLPAVSLFETGTLTLSTVKGAHPPISNTLIFLAVRGTRLSIFHTDTLIIHEV